MRLQSTEDKLSHNEDDCCYDPEADRKLGTFPEPHLMNQGVSVTCGNVVNRVSLKHGCCPMRDSSRIDHSIQIPHDRSYPDPNLHEDTNQLAHISEEDNQCRVDIYKSKYQAYHCERIVDHLQCVEVRCKTVCPVEQDAQHDQDDMYNTRRNDLNER